MKLFVVLVLLDIFNLVHLNVVPFVTRSEKACLIFKQRFDKKEIIPSTSYDPDGFGTNNSMRPIHGGVETRRGEYPHMAALGWRNVDGIDFNCGGSIISEKFILTAAHCITKLNGNLPSVIRVGNSNLLAAKDFAIEWLIKHPNYSSKTHKNDIALIKVLEEINFNYFVLPACLQQNNDFDRNVKATGWGKTSHFGDKSNILLEGSLTIIENDDCFEKVGKELNLDEIFQSQICAENINGTDTCKGDSGGPLQTKRSPSVIKEIKKENNTVLETFYVTEPRIFNIIGITSFGGICGSGLPGIYTRVSSYLDWIESAVWHDEQSNDKIHFE